MAHNETFALNISSPLPDYHARAGNGNEESAKGLLPRSGPALQLELLCPTMRGEIRFGGSVQLQGRIVYGRFHTNTQRSPEYPRFYGAVGKNHFPSGLWRLWPASGRRFPNPGATRASRCSGTAPGHPQHFAGATGPNPPRATALSGLQGTLSRKREPRALEALGGTFPYHEPVCFCSACRRAFFPACARVCA